MGDDQYGPEETAQRRDAVLKIMVNTPPQPHATRPAVRSKKRKSTGADRAKAKPSARRGKP
jgi:hypothetical protein